MKKKIAVLSGDGIGPEVVRQGLKVLDAIAEKYEHEFRYTHADIGAIAIKKMGDPLPEETVEACLNADAVLLGAIGAPKFDNNPDLKVRPEQGLLRLRRRLGLYCNIRPVKTYPKLLHLSPLKKEHINGVDMVIYRELTGGIYFGEKGKSEDDKNAFDTCAYSVSEIERIAKSAFEAATHRRKKVTLIDKANVLETSRLWRKVVTDFAKQYPTVELDFMYVDNAAMQLIIHPKQFDVILTSNMFGDIISDEASVLVGSLGMLPSSSQGIKTSLFEPIHGSFPQAAGKDIANPIATIHSVVLMLKSFGLFEEAMAVDQAVSSCLEKGIGTPDLKPSITYTCSQMGDVISSIITGANVYYDRVSEGISTII